MNLLTIGGRPIGPQHPPYVVAELSANHDGNLNRALRLIEEAKRAGADAVKLQTYRPDTITLPGKSDDFQIKEGLWSGRTLWDLYAEAHLPWEWHRPLFDQANRLGITIFSTPFDETAVDFLEDLGCPAYKIASFEIVDIPLIRYAAATGKPLIISTGMASAGEIQEAIDAALEAGCKQLAILHCVSSYPAPPQDYNLRTIPDMMLRYGVVVGLSDHTLDNVTAIASIALGASIIEKHFTLDRNRGGPDDSFSLEPEDLAVLCRDARIAWQALGQVHYGVVQSEEKSLRYRRSLYFTEDLEQGDVVTRSNVRSVRPGLGLPPKMQDHIMGYRLARSVKRYTPVRLEDLVDGAKLAPLITKGST